MILTEANMTLLNAYGVMARTGLSYESALAWIKANGIHIGRRYYITPARLEESLNALGRNVERVKPDV